MQVIDSIEKSLGRKLDSIIEGITVGNLDCFNKEWSYFSKFNLPQSIHIHCTEQ